MPRKNIKSRRMILELLHHPEGDLTKYRLAKETGTNISWVIQFLKKLEQEKIVKNTKVIDFNRLIDYYVSLCTKTKFFEFYIPQPLKYLKEISMAYALTTYSAENLVSHHLFPSRTDIYIKKEEVEEWKKEFFRIGLIGKGNLRLMVAHDNYIFKFVKKIRNLNVVDIPLLLIDLKREGGVCLQAYDYLVKKHVQEQRN